MQQAESLSTQINHSWAAIQASIEPYVIELRSAFGTSHSSTTSRKNALIKITVNGITGYGECGLPPKKPDVYLADFGECLQYFRSFTEQVLADTKGSELNYNPKFPTTMEYFGSHRFGSDNSTERAIRHLFRLLDTNPNNSHKWTRVARNGIEMALLDIWARFAQKPLFKFIGNSGAQKACFYTVALNDSMDEMKKSAEFGLQHTPYIKIKLNSDVPRGQAILDMLQNLMQERNITNYKYAIDANSDWTPEVALQFLDILRPIKKFIFMIEQPFPVTLSEEERAKWVVISQKYQEEGFLIYADESVSTSEDVDKLKDMIHGINIKLDKTGGIREALCAVSAATNANLQIWVGIMVSSRLSCSAASHILPYATFGGDLDGPLLVTEATDKFTDGMEWDKATGMVRPSPSHNGIGVTAKH